MTLVEKIPQMTDEALTNLLANARRLEVDGSPKQQEQATQLLPALEEAHAARKAVKAEAAAAKRAAPRKPRAAKVVAEAVDDDGDED
jgi:hypothetical protein